MDALDVIFNRRSIRKFTSTPVTDDAVTLLLKAAMYAPSAVNKQPWHYIVFRDRVTCQKIMDVHPYAGMLRQAGVAILVCFDRNLQHDEGYGPVDCSAATQNILLAAHARGLGAVWVGIYPRQARMDAMREIFRLPGHIEAFSLIPLGYPAEEKTATDRFKPDRIHTEIW